jgi:hypothetical protein
MVILMILTRHLLPAILLLVSCLLLIPALQAHPGALDENGGHYDGMSYHCHLPACKMPDTFTRAGRRDSLLFDPDSRDRFFNAADWPLFEGNAANCRSIKNELLVITSRSPVSFTNPRECQVRVGEWFDVYTGRTLTVASQVELDHIIPPRYAHNHGGDRWPPQKKFAFANDPANLVLTEQNQTRRKNDRGPSGWLPREEYQCAYARQWLELAEKYDLQLGQRDRNRIVVLERNCPEDDRRPGTPAGDI